MARRKHNEDLLDRLLANFSIYNMRRVAFHPATLFVGVTLLMVGGAIHAWGKYQHKIIDPVAIQLTPEKINFNQPPSWARTDFRQAILKSANQPVSIMDPDLISHTVQTAKSIGWIEDVQKVVKSRDGLDIELSYRTPVAAVEIDDNTAPGLGDQAQLLLVDRHGVLMPPEAASAAIAIPHICMDHAVGEPRVAADHLNHLHTWSAWPDSRVQDAALLGAALQNDWQAMGLFRIVTMRYANSADDPTIPYELWTELGEKNGVRVLWGNPPGKEQTNEADWQTKLMALKNYVQQNGRLDKLSDRTIDLYSGTAVLVAPSTASRSSIFSRVK